MFVVINLNQKDNLMLARIMKKIVLSICSLFLIFSLVAQDDLPPEVQVDLLIIEAKTFMEADNWSAARRSMEKMADLGIPLPDDYHYQYGKILFEAGEYSRSLTELLIYLNKTGQEGKYYDECISLFLEIKNEKLNPATLRFPDGMSKEQRFKILMRSVTHNTERGNAGHSVADYRMLEARNVNLPDDFLFAYGSALFKNGNFEDALSKFSEYMKQFGREGYFYEDATKFYVEAKRIVETTKAKEAERARIKQAQEAERISVQQAEAAERVRIQQAEEAERIRAQQAKEAYEKAVNNVVSIVNWDLGIELIRIAPGEFERGSYYLDEGTFNHRYKSVISREFSIGKYEVTQKQWKMVMGNNPSESKGSNNPVEMVSWNNAMDFCNRINNQYEQRLPKGYKFRLPTEAEWEYACRAGSTGEYLVDDLDLIAWYCEGDCQKNSMPIALDLLSTTPFLGGMFKDRVARKKMGWSTRPVGKKQPNAWGLYDMYGNVEEWCHDWLDLSLKKSTQIDEKGSPQGKAKVYRGCSYTSDKERCHPSLGGVLGPNERRRYIGFRLVLGPFL